tara:strand:- start:2946 stop:3314 length:369 start_codon:yes stop_codon:yes gene_type:complete
MDLNNLNTNNLKNALMNIEGELHVALLERDQADSRNMELEKEIDELESELTVEKEENELFQDYLNICDAEEAKTKFNFMKTRIGDLETRNAILEERLRIIGINDLKLKKKICGDGLEYLLED